MIFVTKVGTLSTVLVFLYIFVSIGDDADSTETH